MKINGIKTAAVFLAGAALIGTSALAQLWNQPTLMKGASGGGSGPGPITFVNSGAMNVSSGSTTSLSASYTVAAGTNEGLVFCVLTLSNDLVSVIYNGLPATALLTAFSGGYYPQYIYYLPLGNTTAGSHTATITTSANDTIGGVIGEYSHIQQTTTADGTGADFSGSGAPAMTTTTSGDWGTLCAVATSPPTPGSGDVLRQMNSEGGAGNPALLDSNGTLPVGSNTLHMGPSGVNVLLGALKPG
jgi:hypothetical protein